MLPPPAEVRRHPLREMVDGLQFVWTERFLLERHHARPVRGDPVGRDGGLPVYARHRHTGSEGLGSRAAPAVGAAIIALGSRGGRSSATKSRSRNAVGGPGSIPAPGRYNRLVDQLPAVARAARGHGRCNMFSVFVRGTLIQLNAPDHMREGAARSSASRSSPSPRRWAGVGEMRQRGGGGARPGEDGGRWRSCGGRCDGAMVAPVPRTAPRANI